MQSLVDQLVEALEGVRIQDDVDGLWLIFSNGRQQGAINAGNPGPIVRKAVIGWYRQATVLLDRARAEPERSCDGCDADCLTDCPCYQDGFKGRLALNRAKAKEPEIGLLGRLVEHHQRAHGADQTGHNLDCCIARGEDQPGLCVEAHEARVFLQDQFDPEALLTEAGQARREMGERLK